MARRKLGLPNALAGRMLASATRPHGAPAARTQRGVAGPHTRQWSVTITGRIAQPIPTQRPLAVYGRLLGQITRSTKTIRSSLNSAQSLHADPEKNNI
ncbi:MAG TPA: hypothetical protein VIU43_00045, partial [Nitrosospira sp.]